MHTLIVIRLATTSHHYFDSSWDFTNETIHAARSRKRARDLSHKHVTVSEGAANSTSHAQAFQPVVPPLEQEGHPAPLVVSTPSPAYEGVALSDDVPETDQQSNPSSQNPIS